MMRLVKRGLMFGNLYEVSGASMVARYNRALDHLVGKTTKLSEFHIDISGYSPEIGDELGDDLYLNPEGFNRQFIILSTEQKKSPLLNAKFSTSRSILRRFIDDNEEQLFVLTTRDAVAGELVNSVYAANSPAELLKIRKVQVEADTVESHVAASEELGDKIEEFMEKPDAWWDDVLIADMIELSKRTGDIIRNPVELKTQSFIQNNFYTAHFGGVYIFRDMDEPACISVKPLEDPNAVPIDNTCSFEDRYAIAAFLDMNELTEPIAHQSDRRSTAILQQKMDFMVIDVAAENGVDLTDVNRRDLRRLRRRFVGQMPPEYHTLDQLLRWAKGGDEKPRIRPHDPAYFYTLRSASHKDRNLVNMLLAQLAPLDFRKLYICHKDAFYETYRGYSDEKREYVSKFLEEEYLVDKVGAREDLFGPELAMSQEEDDVPMATAPKMGPWGPIPSVHER